MQVLDGFTVSNGEPLAGEYQCLREFIKENNRGNDASYWDRKLKDSESGREIAAMPAS